MADTQVSIIGSGPIGLSVALLLAKFDIRSVILEKRGEVNTHPRSRFVDTNTMELMRHLGVEKAIEDTGLGPDWTACNRWQTAMCGDPIATISSPTFHTVPRDNSPTMPVMTCQDYVENVLLEQVHASALIDIRYLSEVTEVTQSAQGTLTGVTNLATGESYMLAADYLIGADGPHSFARHAIGSVLEADPRPYLMQDVIFEADLSAYVGDRKGGLLYSLTTEGVLIFQPLNGITRWRCQIPRMDGRKLDEQETIAMIRLAAGAQDTPPITLVSTGMWQPTPGCVDVLSRGRIFLAGDAAHVSVPTGGMGNNIGFAGARNLAWKMAYVLKGLAPADVLDTYHVEHRPLALERIDVGVKTTNYMAGIFTAHYSGGDPAEAAAATQQYGDYDGALLGYELQSVLIAPEHSPPPALADPTREYVNCVRNGRRAPHVWMDAEQQHSVLDFFGLDYVMLLGEDVADQPWTQVVSKLAAETGFPISCVRLPQAAPYSATQIVLVRPDGIIADSWESVDTDEERATERLCNVLPLLSNS